MQHRRLLFCTLTLASKHAAGFTAALFLGPPSCRRGAHSMHHHVFRVGRARLLSLTTRAAFAASGTVHLSQQHQALEPGQSKWISSSSRWVSSPSSRGSGFGWRSPGQPALSMSASSRRSNSGAPLRFRGGAMADEPLAAALEAWPWKNPQGILVSPMDKRHYRWLLLPNGLQVMVMVISDPNANKAAAAMSVDVGAASDPVGLPGLAHFLEHMLFLGTSKYPVENAYKSYLAKHGGRSNASTAMDVTTFKFEVLKAIADPEHPYSKFSTGVGLDTRDQLLQFHEKHYHAANMALVVLGKESLDHLETLARDCFKEVRASGSTRPSSESDNAPSAPTLTPGEGETVAEALAKTMRSPWATPPAMTVDLEPLRGMRQLIIQWPMPPVRDLWRNSPTMVLSHLLGHEGPGSLYAALQDQGLANSLSSGMRTAHEDFSLFQVIVHLTREGQARWKEVAALVHAHAGLVRKLPPEDASRAWQESRDMRAIYLRFQQEISPYNAATSLSRRLQLYPSNEVLSAGAVLDLEIDPALFSAFTDYLRPENTLTWRVWKGRGSGRIKGGVDASESGSGQEGGAVETTVRGEGEQPLLEERWYGVPYRVSPTPAKLLQAWSNPSDRLESRLKLPGPNVFIPDDFSLVCDREGQNGCSDSNNGATPAGGRVVQGEAKEGVIKAPDLLETSNEDGVGKAGQLWHRLDTTFRQPRAQVRVVLATPVISDAGAKGRQHAQIMADILHKVLAQRTYDAQLAGLHWGVSRHTCGYVLQVSGFSQKIDLLLQQVVEAFLDPVAAAGGPEEFAKQFRLAKERALTRTKSWVMSRPDEVAHYYNGLALKLSDDLVPDPGHIKAAEATNLEECLSQHKEALAKVLPVGLVYGNTSQDDARRIWKTMTERLDASGCRPLPEDEYPRSLTGVLPRGKRVNLRLDVPNRHDENSSAIAYFQLGERDERRAATLLLLSQMMREPCYTELRTKQQIGYIVSSGVHNYGRGARQLGFSVHALSKTLGPDEICSRIDAFLPQFRELVRNMSDEEFDMHVGSQVSKQLEPPTKADAEFGLILGEVFSGDLKWDRAAVKAELLKTITRQEVLDLLGGEMLDGDGAKRLNVLVYGKNHPRPERISEDETTTIELVPETLQTFTRTLAVQDTTVTPQEAIANATS
ncbi:unnamed protein product [Ectocarpus sp. CCAP 1310/34]|nr:unnamed protein product [Ectocarpus sp. CCAP 1310/34]